MPESIRNMITPPRNSATREPENKNTASQTQEQTTAQVCHNRDHHKCTFRR
ncbi:putative ATP-dependent Clp protease proteolytic subunit (Endopeptidase Clp) [Escherichia coli]|nr:putative ATP-dependent Clp protease proteolytic subunit (Endopeptidase Clp) [Escherichia coli]